MKYIPLFFFIFCISSCSKMFRSEAENNAIQYVINRLNLDESKIEDVTVTGPDSVLSYNIITIYEGELSMELNEYLVGKVSYDSIMVTAEGLRDYLETFKESLLNTNKFLEKHRYDDEYTHEWRHRYTVRFKFNFRYHEADVYFDSDKITPIGDGKSFAQEYEEGLRFLTNIYESL